MSHTFNGVNTVLMWISFPGTSRKTTGLFSFWQNGWNLSDRWNVNIFKETQLSSIWLFYQIYKTAQCYFFLSKFQLYSLLLYHVIKQPTQASRALCLWPTLLPNCDLHSQTSGNSTHSANWLSMFSNCPSRNWPWSSVASSPPAHQALGLIQANANLLHRCHLDGSMNTKSVNWWFYSTCW